MILGLAAVIPGFVREAEAQESSLYYRATLAFAVDSLVRTAPAQVNDARVKRVRDFVADPFGTALPPTSPPTRSAPGHFPPDRRRAPGPRRDRRSTWRRTGTAPSRVPP